MAKDVSEVFMEKEKAAISSLTPVRKYIDR